MAIRMVDAIRDGKIVVVSEQEAKNDDLFVLRTHETTLPLEPSLSSTNPTPQRIREKSEPFVKPVAKWHSYQPEYSKNHVVRELIDNFHWEISKARKQKNLSRLQLAHGLGVPENVVKMLEQGELPRDDFVIINKVQSILGINLRRDGKSFDTPLSSLSPSTVTPTGPSYIPKLDYSKATLADFQRMKEQERKVKEASREKKQDDLFGGDIELIE